MPIFSLPLPLPEAWNDGAAREPATITGSRSLDAVEGRGNRLTERSIIDS